MKNLFMIDPMQTPDLSQDSKKIDEFISLHQTLVAEYKLMQNYYDGKHKILDKEQKDLSQPNNKVVTNFCKLITTTKVGYMFGKSISLKVRDPKLAEKLTEIDRANDSQDKNKELGKTASIKGNVFEILYIKNEKDVPMPRYAKVSPEEVFLVTDNTLEPSVLYGVRYYYLGEEMKVEIYSDKDVKYLTKVKNGYVINNEIPHYFEEVPVYPFKNNEEETGDFEPIMTIQDDYNEKISDISNELSYFREAILKIVNMSGTQKADIDSIRENKAVLLDEGGNIDWALKPMNDAVIENHKKTLRENLFMVSCIPDWASEQFAGSLSGIAIAFKLTNLEIISADTESKFKAGLRKRYKLIVNFLNKQGYNFDADDIVDFTFSRNVPKNNMEIADMIVKLRNFVSDETLLGLLPFVEDIRAEIEAVEKQNEKELNSNEMTSILSKYTSEPIEETPENEVA